MMDWLNDLVWVGNTLYPRWLVLMPLVLFFGGSAAVFWSWLRW